MNRNVVLNRRILTEFDPLLHCVLKDAHVSPSMLYYEDFLQELRLKLLSFLDRFEGNPLGADRYAFTAYARKGLYWGVMDLLRKEKRQWHTPLEKEDVLDAGLMQVYQQSHLSIQLFEQEARRRLNRKELAVYYLLLESDYTMQEIADRLGCRRQTVHNIRQRIRQKLAPCKTFLSE